MNELKYVRYSRKSSESKEKQALSIADQNKECEIFANKESINIALKFDEEKSAFKPDRREKFNKMVELIKNGKVDAILTWKPDRLCRNPKEGGIILQLLQDGILKEIRTPLGDIYTPDSDHLILQIHFGMANQYSRVLSQNVKRGMRRKIIDRKEYPRPSILGFEGYGERGQRNIRPYPGEAIHIQKAFKLASTGLHSLSYISNTLYEEGFRTRKGKKIGKSHLQLILTCSTYYGYFKYNGELYEGNYEPLISKGLFDLVQERLNDRSKPKNNKWNRQYIKLFKCGNCACAITTTIKRKFVKSKNKYIQYTYYHCTHRKGNCKEMPLTELELNDLLYKEVSTISIDTEVWKLGIELIKAKYKDQIEKNKHHFQYLHIKQSNIRDQISKLIEMRSNDELTKDEFLEQKNRLLENLSSLGNVSADNEHTLKTWLELMDNFFDSAYQIKDIIKNSNAETKQSLLLNIGQNFLIKDKRLTISFKKPFDILLNLDYRTDVLPNLDSNQDERIQSPLSYH